MSKRSRPALQMQKRAKQSDAKAVQRILQQLSTMSVDDRIAVAKAIASQDAHVHLFSEAEVKAAIAGALDTYIARQRAIADAQEHQETLAAVRKMLGSQEKFRTA